MKKLLLTCVLSGAGFIALASASYADTNATMKDSQYCRDNSMDVICMGPEMLAMRTKMMAMTKAKAMENRSMYCRNGQGGKDPICDPKMMNDTTGY
jgi:hypothetical protein